MLVDPHLLSGVDDAYFAEIPHAATRQALTVWIKRMPTQAGDCFPERVTAFLLEMAMYGKFTQPHPR